MSYLNLVDLMPILFNKFCQRIVSIRLILQRVEIIFREEEKAGKGTYVSMGG
jgi:hypothetical protein